jgi:hypothetical protein
MQYHHQHQNSEEPFSIAVELDNHMIAAATLKGSDLMADDREAVDRADFFHHTVWNGLEDRLAIAMDLARRGDIEVTAADVLKVCEWAKAEPKDLSADTLCLVVEVAELFATKQHASEAAAKRRTVAAKPKTGKAVA